jgi:putative ABC transport system permease protein
MSLALLLFVRSFRSGWKRLSLIVGAVGTGVLILLLFTTGFNGLTGRSSHTSWQQAIFQAEGNGSSQKPVPGVQPLYVTLSSTSNIDTLWRNTPIDVTILAASGANSPHLHDLPTPGPGEYYVSPGLRKVMNEHPTDNLGQRFGTKLLGIVPDKYVTSPDELSVIRGIDLAQVKHLSETGASAALYHIDETQTAFASYGKVLTVVLYVGIFIMLFPVMLLVSIATQLGSAQREQRYAALRLVGATKAQVRHFMMVESLIASVAGIVVGFALYATTRPLVLGFKFEDMRFWPSDMALHVSEIVSIIVVTLFFTAIANWWGMRHVQTSPLGVVRQGLRLKNPHWWRLIPLMLGLGILGLAAVLPHEKPGMRSTIAQLILASVVVLMFGLVIAGPYVTHRLSGFMAQHAKRAETLLGMKYISLHSGSVFRSVAGVVVALFAGSFYLASTSGIESLSARTVSDNGFSQLHANAVLIGAYSIGDPLPERQSNTFEKLRYIQNVAEVKEVGNTSVIVMSCQAAAQYTSIQCPANTQYVGIDFSKQDLPRTLYGSTETDVYNHIRLANSGIDVSVVLPHYFLQMDYGSIDKLRSFVAVHYMQGGTVSAFVVNGTDAKKPNINPIIREFAGLAYIGIGSTMLIAVVSLAISTIGGLLERRRSLVTLRLTGMTVGSLKRVVVIESLVPLLSVTIVSAGLGIATGFVLMYQLTTTAHSVLSPSYLLLFGGCIVAAVVTIVGILPSIKHIASPDNMQTE